MKNEYFDFFTKNRKFENDENNEIIIPQVFQICFKLAEVNSLEIINMVCLLNGLDDETKRLDMTQFIYDVIISFYDHFPDVFFPTLLNNINLIYPHAKQKTVDFLMPMLYNDQKVQQQLCDSLDSINIQNLKIFKEIYLLMIDEDEVFYNEKIMNKLNFSS